MQSEGREECGDDGGQSVGRGKAERLNKPPKAQAPSRLS